MGTAGVRPVARPHPFALRALLNEELARRIEQQHRERAVQRSATEVGVGLRHDTDLAVVAVDQNELIVVARDHSAFGLKIIHAAPHPG
jgi:hypothetical protein